MSQHRYDSVLEVLTNIAIGMAISAVAQVLIFPMYGIHIGAATHAWIIWWFTVVSVARQYALRRLFNGKSPYRWLKEKFNG